MSKSKAVEEKIIDEIILDLSDRRGLRQGWDQIDDRTKAEIRGVWITIVRKQLKA